MSVNDGYAKRMAWQHRQKYGYTYSNETTRKEPTEQEKKEIWDMFDPKCKSVPPFCTERFAAYNPDTDRLEIQEGQIQIPWYEPWEKNKNENTS